MIPVLPKMLAMGKSGAPPFSLSGSWETGDEGWTLSAGRWQPGGNFGINARTGVWVATMFNTDTADYTLPGELITGLTVTASIWVTSSQTYEMLRAIDGGSFEVVATSSGSTGWRQMSGVVAEGISGATSLTIRIRGTRSGFSGAADDWSIVGA